MTFPHVHEKAPMPYLNPTAYLKTLDEFVDHWHKVDGKLSPGALRLSGDYGIDGLKSSRDSVKGCTARIDGARKRKATLKAERDAARRALRERVIQFRRLVGALLPATTYSRALPSAPLVSAGSRAWTNALQEVTALWTKIESDEPEGVQVPLQIAGGYTLQQLVRDGEALRATEDALANADKTLVSELEAREKAWEEAYSRMVQYRQLVAASLGASHELVKALPRLSAPYRPRKKLDGAAP